MDDGRSTGDRQVAPKIRILGKKEMTGLGGLPFQVSIPAVRGWLLTMVVVLATVVETLAGDGRTGSYPRISLSSQTGYQGDLILLKVQVKDGERPKTLWMGSEIHTIHGPNQKHWVGFLGVDLNSAPKAYPLRVRSLPSGAEKQVQVRIQGKDYGERRLTLPKEMVDLDPEALERVKRETEIMKRVVGAPPSPPLWAGSFVRPTEGEVVGIFGRRSVINGQPRSPHSGVDLRGEKGTPVKAMNHGRVVLTCDHFFTGQSVVVDHGGGIQSMYFHLDGIQVRENQKVQKGAVIGTVGSTGRSTGPHLHLGVRVNGARVDPLRMIDLSRETE